MVLISFVDCDPLRQESEDMFHVYKVIVYLAFLFCDRLASNLRSYCLNLLPNPWDVKKC